MIEKLKKSIESIGYVVEINDNGMFIYHDHISWIIRLIRDENNFFIPIFYFRMKRDEEVTDLHDIIPSCFTLILRMSGRFSFRFLGQHNDWSQIEDELYGMYIFPSQPMAEKVRLNNENDYNCIFDILYCILIFHSTFNDVFSYVDGGKEEYIYNSSNMLSWVDKIISVFDKEISYVCNERVNPDWFYFRSYGEGISIFKDKKLAKNIRLIYEKNKTLNKSVLGVESRLFITKEIRNCVSKTIIDRAVKFLDALDDAVDFIVVPQDNLTFFIATETIISIFNDGGLTAFYKEKERVRKRQENEIKLLFSDKIIEWRINKKSDCSLFEDLVLELLAREPYILSVKKVAPTNQGDNGRDLICDYDARYSEYRIDRSDSQLKTAKLIVQCKTNLNGSKKLSIGKSDVDVANTIYDYKPDGYLLVVNTQITRDLTEYLEKIKARGELLLLDWWNAFDLEERLRVNPDIMGRYSLIVGYK